MTEITNYNPARLVRRSMPKDSHIMGLPSHIPKAQFGDAWRQLFTLQRMCFVQVSGDIWTLSEHDVRSMHDDGLIRYDRRQRVTLLGQCNERGSEVPIWLARRVDAREDVFSALCVDVSGGPVNVFAEATSTDITEAVIEVRSTLANLDSHDSFKHFREAVAR